MKKFLLYVLLGGVCVSLTACGNAISTSVVGHAGFSHNESGGIVIEVESCGAELDRINLSGPYVDGSGNKEYSRMEAETPQSGYFAVDVSDPGPNWTDTLRVEMSKDPNELLIAYAFASGKDRQTVSTSATIAEIRALKPGEIIMGDLGDEPTGKIVTQEEFTRCR